MKNLIQNFIENMTLTDIQHFLEKNHYQVSKEDQQTVLYYIKNNWLNLYNGDTSIFETIQKKVEPNTYQIMIELYNSYKGYLK